MTKPLTEIDLLADYIQRAASGTNTGEHRFGIISFSAVKVQTL